MQGMFCNLLTKVTPQDFDGIGWCSQVGSAFPGRATLLIAPRTFEEEDQLHSKSEGEREHCALHHGAWRAIDYNQAG